MECRALKTNKLEFCLVVFPGESAGHEDLHPSGGDSRKQEWGPASERVKEETPVFG